MITNEIKNIALATIDTDGEGIGYLYRGSDGRIRCSTEQSDHDCGLPTPKNDDDSRQMISESWSFPCWELVWLS